LQIIFVYKSIIGSCRQDKSGGNGKTGLCQLTEIVTFAARRRNIVFPQLGELNGCRLPTSSARSHGARRTFFNDVEAFMRYWIFPDWHAVLRFMFVQLELEPD